ncbi:MAG: hypothetical protein IPL06_22675 [Betaproteobacteria bacterium]|nr:hypothetical protein [Betaproteobacteria bacterium]
MNDAAPARDPEGNTRIVHILYILHGLAPFTMWLLAVVAIIIGMVKKSDLQGTVLASHVSWLSRTFWWGLLWIVICTVLTFLFIISIILAILYWLPFTVLFIWYPYRVIKGWLKLNDGLAIA